ncbi:hypothetical protein BLA39750_02212 [Burkholderia lata]|uniref:HTH cro/C1-type domain-containing protein n=1 Tax=Burkholderia lata (strain ATCC 17760 / DSM 23089 / LMG 22485 / NCIMB 9086 / R18194 / 383) TaxID=482957 RepID=A0A6P2WL05_BURL3|nr:helix-turn-helix transcriptional regulator [Burkholderia lata]VWC95773.1 hypothetical protein BLA39750_02212 [Burkholderia lata]
MATVRYPEFNTEWFEHQMKKHDLTYNDLAGVMEIPFQSARSTVYKVFHGEQRLRADWAAKLADRFGVGLEDVLKEAGIVDAKMIVREKKKGVRIEHELTGDALVKIKGAGGRRTAPLPPGMPEHTQGVRIGMDGPFNGWIAYCLPQAPMKPDTAGQLCVVQIGDAVKIGRVERGNVPGYYDVTPVSGRKVEEVRIEWAAPVLWMAAGE